MAPRIKAVNAYRPRIEQGNTVQKPELIRESVAALEYDSILSQYQNGHVVLL